MQFVPQVWQIPIQLPSTVHQQSWTKIFFMNCRSKKLKTIFHYYIYIYIIFKPLIFVLLKLNNVFERIYFKWKTTYEIKIFFLNCISAVKRGCINIPFLYHWIYLNDAGGRVINGIHNILFWWVNACNNFFFYLLWIQNNYYIINITNLLIHQKKINK